MPNFKYIKREWKNGRWRYWYDDVKNGVKTKASQALDKAAEAAKTTADKATNSLIKTANKIPDKANVVLDKVTGVANKVYDDKNNIYDIHSQSYDEKIAKVKESKEWKDIVARNDPEYVKKDASGNTKYLIDNYIVDKKHPVLDAIEDISSGRKITTNEITKDSTVAGIKDHLFGAITTGMLVASVVSKALTEKYKLKQGSYDDDINNLMSAANKGSDYVKKVGVQVNDVSKEDVKTLASMLSTASKANTSFKEDDVVTAAKIIMESQAVKDKVGDTEAYRTAEKTLTNLSDEELRALSIMLKALANK